MKEPLEKTVYAGTFIHTPRIGEVEVFANAVVGVDENGLIEFIDKDFYISDKGNFDGQAKARGWIHWGNECSIDLVECAGNGTGFWFPGFVGTYFSNAPVGAGRLVSSLFNCRSLLKSIRGVHLGFGNAAKPAMTQRSQGCISQQNLGGSSGHYSSSPKRLSVLTRRCYIYLLPTNAQGLDLS